jgi:L-lactate utilization protein LutC
LCILSLQSFASAQCGDLSGCERKSCEIEYQIDKAKEYSNQHKVDGLTKALKEVKANCTNAGLKEKIAEKIESSEEDLAEYRADLEEAKQYGRTQKVKKYQHKIDDEIEERDRLMEELSEIQ